MLVIGIESSCDETAVSIVRDGTEVLSSQIYSQIETHKVFGGVVPEVAAREHLKVIPGMVALAMEEAAVSYDDLDAIAVTRGPGLIGALLVGISYAKGMALRYSLPLIPVNHVHAHVHGALLGIDQSIDSVFPCLAAVVSGGHTNLYYMSNPTSFKLIAHTIDDACGESFDKVAKLFNLGYPGGPKIEKMATKGRSNAFRMPVLMEQKSRLEFSYSGLKTHMVNLRNSEQGEMSDQWIADACAAFQEAALDQLKRKLESALVIQPETRSVLIAGGVAANNRFRAMLSSEIKVPILSPRLRFCSDNGAMIAALGYHQFINSESDRKFYDYSWDAFSRYDFRASRR